MFASPAAPATVNPSAPKVRMASLSSKVPIAKRNKVLEKIHGEFCRIYTPILHANPRLAHDDALRQEAALHATANKASYISSAANLISRLKRRAAARDQDDVGIDGEYGISSAPSATERTPVALVAFSRADLESYITSRAVLAAFGHALEVPLGPDLTNEKADTPVQACERCGTRFVPTFPLSEASQRACRHHWGGVMPVKREGRLERMFRCCGTLEESADMGTGGRAATGCTYGPHVFKEEDVAQLSQRRQFVATRPAESPRTLVAMDCEMCYTTGGLELARMTLLGGDGGILQDVLVAPTHPVIDLNTRFSGITAKELGLDAATGLANGTPGRPRVTFAEAQELVLSHVSSSTVLLGHGLENDLKALGIVHNAVIDTVALFPHPRGLPFRYGLRRLVKEHLQRDIQRGESGGTPAGHSSVEDALACLELLSWRHQQAPGWLPRAHGLYDQQVAKGLVADCSEGLGQAPGSPEVT